MPSVDDILVMKFRVGGRGFGENLVNFVGREVRRFWEEATRRNVRVEVEANCASMRGGRASGSGEICKCRGVSRNIRWAPMATL